ncbi:MAG: 50S ribosomal protein L32 [Holosporales bacterium]|jgi:large subunit ribosomal protein L32|nr:50S ribosomal protein L32 [Holosporales bacterium]
MAVPKKKTSKSKKGMRHSHDGLSAIGTSICENCDALRLPHYICKYCGTYGGKTIVQPKDDDFEEDDE